MSITKKYLAKKNECKVTFKLNGDSNNSFDEVALVGEFNDWDAQSHLMKKLKNGDFSITINLETERAYQFKYFADKSQWINEPEADNYINDGFNSQNSVIFV